MQEISTFLMILGVITFSKIHLEACSTQSHGAFMQFILKIHNQSMFMNHLMKSTDNSYSMHKNMKKINHINSVSKHKFLMNMHGIRKS